MTTFLLYMGPPHSLMIVSNVYLNLKPFTMSYRRNFEKSVGLNLKARNIWDIKFQTYGMAF